MEYPFHLQKVISRVPKDALSSVRITRRRSLNYVPWKRRITPSLGAVSLRNYSINQIPLVVRHEHLQTEEFFIVQIKVRLPYSQFVRSFFFLTSSSPKGTEARSNQIEFW